MLTTTLREIQANNPAKPCWRKLLRKIGGMRRYGLDTPLPVSRVLDLIGLDDTLRVVDCINPTVARLLTVGFCTPVLRFVRPYLRGLVKVAHLHTHGEATDAELADARDAAEEAASARAKAWAQGRESSEPRRNRMIGAAAWIASHHVASAEAAASWIAASDYSACPASARTEQIRLVRYVCDNWEGSPPP